MFENHLRIGGMVCSDRKQSELSRLVIREFDSVTTEAFA